MTEYVNAEPSANVIRPSHCNSPVQRPMASTTGSGSDLTARSNTFVDSGERPGIRPRLAGASGRSSGGGPTADGFDGVGFDAGSPVAAPPPPSGMEFGCPVARIAAV